MPKVSVIIPVYNVEKYLRACLDSVVNQTLRDIEIICVDDGSTDSSPAILAEYAAKDPRVRVITQPKSNAGAARNAGMAVATGEYLGFVDSDDWCELTLFEKAYSKAKAVNADLISWEYDRFDNGTGRRVPQRFSPQMLKLKEPFGPEDLGISIFAPLALAPWSRLLRLEFIKREGLCFQSLPRSNDVYFGSMVQALAQRQAVIDEVLYHYRVGITTNLQSGNAKTPDTVIDAWTAVADELRVRAIFEKFRRPFAFASAGSFFYVLGVMGDPASCLFFFTRLRELYETHPIFVSIGPCDIENDQTSRFLGMLKSSDTLLGFLVQQELYYRNSLGNVWRISQDLRREVAARKAIENELRRDVADRQKIESELKRINGEQSLLLDERLARINEQRLLLESQTRKLELNAQTLHECEDKVTRLQHCVVESVASKHGIRQVLKKQIEESRRQLENVRSELTSVLNSNAYRWGAKIVAPAEYARKILRSAKMNRGVKKIRKAFKLALPTFYMRKRLERKFGYKVAPVSGSAVARLLVDGLPFAVFAILSQRVGSDRRPLKYFLPYGKMRRYVQSRYGRDHVRHADVGGLVGVVRNWLPYGLVQWWDFGQEKLERKNPVKAVRKPTISPERRAAFMRNLAYWRRRVATCADGGTPLVSVVVPAYNVEQYLPQTLDSLVIQTMKAIEIIVVDDGSSDGTPVICDDYAARYPVVRVIHQKNGGRSAARNAGLAIARGKYIGFVDGDDYVEPEMFETMAAMLEMDAQADFAHCGVKVEFQYEVSAEDRKWAQKYFEFEYLGTFQITPSFATKIDNSVCNKLYRRRFLSDNRISFPRGGNNEDVVFSFYVMGKASRMVALDLPLYHYLRNSQGIMAAQVEEFKEQAKIPDSLVFAMPLVLEYLVADDRRDLLGAFFRRLCGAANGFKNEEAAKHVARILNMAGYFYNREFLDVGDLGWVRNQLSAYANFDWADLSPIAIDRTLLPALRPRFSRVKDPLVSVVIPVYNQEVYLNFCLESVRKQTFSDIEIICIDDGSIDHSLALLEKLAAVDGRIRVIHRENGGAAATRNFGIRESRGKYIVFVDADDYVERTYIAEVVERMERDELDMCLIDLDCFEYNTRKPLEHYWCIRKQLSFYPRRPVFKFDDLKQYRCMTGPCTAVWRRQFLIEQHVEFPLIRNGEDAIFWMRAIPYAKRIGLINKVFYHYRRGNPSSAVSKMHSTAGVSNALVTVRKFAEEWERMRDRLTDRAKALLAGRLSLEIVYHARISKDVLPFMQQEGFGRFALETVEGVAETAPDWAAYEALKKLPIPEDQNASIAYRKDLPAKVRRLIERIEREREKSTKDLYLITGQLNSADNAPIDSWTFFKWLQKNGIPSRYVMWKKHEWYPKLRKTKELKDVIVLDGNGVDDYEFLFKCKEVLPRCKVLGQENGALNWRLRKWAYYLPDCLYVYLEHGIKYLKYSVSLGRFLSTFNAINDTSSYEAELLLKHLPGYVDNGVKPDCFVGGLPRLDTYKDERDPQRKEFVVFMMLTWREAFNAGQKALEKSAYYHALRAFLSSENVKRLAEARIKVKVAAHHHLVSHIQGLDFGESVEIVPQSDVAYWKSHADCCLTDYSSISFDYMFLGKPVIFWIPDREDPLLTANDYSEQLFAEERERALPNVCHSVREVVELLERYAERRFELEPEIKSSLGRFFQHRTHQCQHLYDALEEACCRAAREETHGD